MVQNEMGRDWAGEKVPGCVRQAPGPNCDGRPLGVVVAMAEMG